jgi:hypothetical protein
MFDTVVKAVWFDSSRNVEIGNQTPGILTN